MTIGQLVSKICSGKFIGNFIGFEALYGSLVVVGELNDPAGVHLCHRT